MRHVCRFSCGAASAVATKLILAEQSPENVLIVNAYVKEEHEDNRRFLADCERWFGHPITVVRNEEYEGSTDAVWMKSRFIVSFRGAPCSTKLKRETMGKLAQAGDVTVLGFTLEETDRFDSLCDRFPEETFRAPLIEKRLGKQDCLAMIQKAGIELPMMYRLGYDNANCIGCPKGGQAYWQNIRADFSERFAQIKTIQESIGPGASFLRFRSGPRKGERMALAELPEGRGNMKSEPEFSCSYFCQEISNQLKGDSMNTSFKPSEFDKQAAASLDMIDEQAAAERVQKILHPEPQGARSQAQAGPTLTPAPQTQPQAPAPRKKRSDAGVPKKAPADPDEIVLIVTKDDVDSMLHFARQTSDFDFAMRIQDQLIRQLQKRVATLSKAK